MLQAAVCRAMALAPTRPNGLRRPCTILRSAIAPCTDRRCLQKCWSVAGESSSSSDVEDVKLPSVGSFSDLDAEKEWISGMINLWLDDEWLPLDVHRELGNQVGEAYSYLRRAGEADLGCVLLGMSTQLEAFDFRETFTNPFEVSNKVSELLMMKMGREVCCVSDKDRERLAHYESLLKAGKGSESL